MIDQTGGSPTTDSRVAMYLGILRGAFRPSPQEIRVPPEPACHIPESQSDAFALGWRMGWLAGKFNTD